MSTYECGYPVALKRQGAAYDLSNVNLHSYTCVNDDSENEINETAILKTISKTLTQSSGLIYQLISQLNSSFLFLLMKPLHKGWSRWPSTAIKTTAFSMTEH